jgi:hypothetical protein
MADLVMVDGKYHCNPKKICRMGDERVVCRAHGGERVRVQMDEVSPGIFECKPHSLCFSAQPGKPVEAPRPAQPGIPVQSPYTMATPHIPQRAAAQSRVEVWCCHHGTRLPEKNCELIDETYYVCKDASRCLMSELETPAALRSKHATHCPPMLCRTHDRLREISFMRIREDRLGYECAPGHMCSNFGRPNNQ